MAFSVPPGYSKLSEEKRYGIILSGIDRLGIDKVFDDFSEITRLRRNTAWGTVYLSDLEQIMKNLPEQKCPSDSIYSRASNKCIKNTAANRSRVEEKNELLFTSPSKLNRYRIKENDDNEIDDEDSYISGKTTPSRSAGSVRSSNSEIELYASTSLGVRRRSDDIPKTPPYEPPRVIPKFSDFRKPKVATKPVINTENEVVDDEETRMNKIMARFDEQKRREAILMEQKMRDYVANRRAKMKQDINWIFEPSVLMLAETAPKDLNDLDYPVFVSTKYDGHHGVRAKGTVLSMGLIPLPNKAIVKCLTEVLPEGFDFELVVNRNLNETASWVRSINAGIPPRLDVLVFDWVTKGSLENNEPFEMRYKRIQNWSIANYGIILSLQDSTDCAGIYIHTLLQTEVSNAAELQEYADLVFDRGDEGVVIRLKDSPYVQGRTGNMLKMKKHIDDEGKIIGFNRGDDGLLKSFRIQWTVPTTGEVINFNISSGLTLRTRKFYWERRDRLLHQFVKFSYQGMPNSQIARHAKILGIRYASEMANTKL
jgi:hypothetical protein